jgi:mono/diheme cytochrome c family protein
MPRWIARAFVVGAVLTLVACGASTPSRPSGPRPAPSVSEGRRLFVAQECGACHALAAAGTKGEAGGPNFDTSEKLDRPQLRRSLTLGSNGMPSYAGILSARQMDAVTEFLYVATHRPRTKRR